MADQCALGQDGQLLNATEIKWYNNPDNAQPIEPTSSMQGVMFYILLVFWDTTNTVFCQVNTHVHSEWLQVHG